MMQLFLLSCQKATLLMEKKLSTGHITYYQKWQLQFHTKICESCRRFAKQSQAIEEAFRKKLENEDSTGLGGTDEMPYLTPEMRDKLLNRLRSEE